MKRRLLYAVLALAIGTSANAGMKTVPLTEAWQTTIRAAAPERPTVTPKQRPTLLVFSLMTGFKHWVTPHTTEVVKIIGEKSDAYDVVVSNDVKMFEPENIKRFDVIVLNNTCSDRRKRDLFFDATKDAAAAARLEASLLAHIARGNGLVAIHGAVTMQNNSAAFSKMLGGSFDFHPRQQEVTCRVVDPTHPLVAAFKGQPFVHVDEPYLFKNAYADKNFRPLLAMDTALLDCGKRDTAVRSDIRYVAWIKRHGKGRVFYCSPSHNAQSFERPELLQFLLDGIQYAAGDLVCDDAPGQGTGRVGRGTGGE
jgi:uncharacterized protein